MASIHKLIRCDECYNSENNTIELCRNKIYRSLHEVQCVQCSNMWLVCIPHGLRFKFRKYYLAKKHVQQIDHQLMLPSTELLQQFPMCRFIPESNNVGLLDSKMPARDDHNTDNDDNVWLDNNESDNDVCTTLSEFEACQQPVNVSTYNTNMRRYIERESQEVGSGLKHIIACAYFMNHNIVSNTITSKEALFHLKASSFCYQLTSSQNAHFASLCDMMSTTFYHSFHHNDTTLRTSPPLTSKDIDRYYLNNSTSITKNIPIPTVNESHDHAYVSIKEAIQHFLSFETYFDGMLTKNVSQDYKNILSKNSLISHTKAMNYLREKVKSNIKETSLSPLLLYIILWSDDFEPNNVKQHKKSTWIKTMTIAPPHDCQTSPRHTYIIALGSKSSDHEVINHAFYQELNLLQKPVYMYCKATNSNIPIVVETLAVSADRPERSSLNAMLGHNGLTSRRWRYSAYIDKTRLKSCVICAIRRIKILSGKIYLCDNEEVDCCWDWDFNHYDMNMPLPDDYPTKQHPQSPQAPKNREVNNIRVLKPVALSYDFLMKGVKFCFFNCFHRTWNKTTALAYLKSLCINEKYGTDCIYNVAVSCRSIEDFDESTLFDYLKFPVIWTSGLKLHQCIDTPMHQLFQGVVKSIFDLTCDWLTRKVHNHYNKFCNNINHTLSTIHDLGLDWCRMEKLIEGRSFTTSGWQAEQYLAFARCTLLVYSSIRDTVGHNERGIDEHEYMCQALLCFISRVMVDDKSSETNLMHYIKCFLSACDLFENVAYVMDDANPIWFTKGNFLSLLNLPSQINEFGSLRNFWEGSRERSIQQIKPFLMNVRYSSSYYKTKLHRMYVTQSLQNMHDDHTLLLSEDVTRYDRFSSFKVYGDKIQISTLASEHQAVSVVMIHDKENALNYYVCQRIPSTKTCKLYCVNFVDQDGFNKCGLWYAPISISTECLPEQFTRDQINNMLYDYAILCPCISSEPILQKCYTAFSKKWQYRIMRNQHQLPELSYDFILHIYDNHQKKQTQHN